MTDTDLDFISPPAMKMATYQLFDQKAVAEVDYLRAVHKHFVAYLASQYRCGMAREIAGLCDETLDRSGRLLGEVRTVARTPQVMETDNG
jgi:hypothetical protein